jgi:hypothetical protein
MIVKWRGREREREREILSTIDRQTRLGSTAQSCARNSSRPSKSQSERERERERERENLV